MKIHHARLRAALLFCLLLIQVTAFAASADVAKGERPLGSGGLEAVDRDGRPLGPCPLRHTDVKVDIAGFVSRVVVTQQFENPFSDPIEAVYTFPLSHRAAVDAMWVRIGDRTIRGEIKRRAEAREIYERARENGQIAALLDQERPNIFTQHIANLMPGASVEVEIHYVETLEFEAGAFEFSFPTVVGPRFIPGQPIAGSGSGPSRTGDPRTGQYGSGRSPDTTRVPDASRITPPITPEGTRAGHDIAIEVEIDAGVSIGRIDSELHEIDVTRSGVSHATVTLRRRDEIPNRDFALRYEVAAEELRSGVLVHREPGEDGYATFIILPPKRVTKETAAPKEMVFVIDRSGSQSGLPLTKAKETMLWILEHLNPDDTFQVIDFGSTSNALFDRPQRATLETKRQARAYIGALRANGGTMMAEAIRRVASVPADDNRLRIVTFMTDGYIGNDFEVLSLVRSVRGTSRWFPFGTGNSVNRYLIDGMAREGGGEAEFVLLNMPGDVVAKKFYERVRNPVLTNVHLEFEGLEVEEVFPQEISDVWSNRPLIIHARFKDAGRGRIIVHGHRKGGPYREVLEVELPAVSKEHGALASMWARAKVKELQSRDLEALQTGQFPKALEDEIVEVALAHRILTQFTSFVAVEDRVVNEGGKLRTETVPVEMPQGVTYEGALGRSGSAVAFASRTLAPGHANSARSRLVQSMRLGPLFAQGVRSEASGDFVLQSPVAMDVSKIAETDARSFSAQALKKLAPAIRAAVANPGGSHPLVDIRDGKVKVKLRLRTGARTRAQLERAGLELLQLADRFAIGWIELEALAALAELEVVEGIEPG